MHFRICLEYDFNAKFSKWCSIKKMLRKIDSLTFHYGIIEIIGQATQIYIILHPLTALLLFYN